MYALENGLNMKWLAVIFCIFTTLAAIGTGNMVQANSISSMMYDTFKISPYITGILMSVITAVVILSGVKQIARVCEKLVPFMAVFYVAGCLIILAMNAAYLLPALGLIAKHAFTAKAVGGGFAGATVMMAARYGISRGLFSNESGLGSAPIVAAAAQTKNPVRQALVSATGTFWDTVVVCAMTGLVLVSSILKDPVNLDNLKGTALTKAAFAQIPLVGPIILTVGLFTFVFSTILGWSYYGERAAEYLLGKKVILPYRIVWVIGVFIGPIMQLTLVWDIADALNGAMAVPNLISLLLLSGIIVAETKKYLWDGNIEMVAEQVYFRKLD